MKRTLSVTLLLMPMWPAMSQTDTISFPFPVPIFTSYQHINGTFAEFRNTLSSNHFHNGTDIGQPDGYPVYSSLNGTVYSLSPSSASGSNAFVRIRSDVPGGTKHISYVHIEPAPGLAVGNTVVAGVTVIGNILSGLGHVHMTEREIGSDAEINSLRPGGGLTPFSDTWAPVFQTTTLRFYAAGTRTVMSAGALHGPVDIVVRVMERNSDEPVGGTRTNNGTYAVGYTVMSADTQTVVYAPPDSGLRYRFDRMPNNAYVGYVFDEAVSNTSEHHYILTNGLGANAVNTSRAVPTNALDTDLLTPGPYVVHLFTFDTRDNRSDWYVPVTVTDQDLTPPGRPTLLSVLPDSEDIVVSWLPPTDPDLKGYRLYVHSPLGGDFAIGETTLTKDMNSYRLRLPAGFPSPQNGLPRVQLRLTAVDTADTPNESAYGDTYVATPGTWQGVLPGRRYLVVDGFDRFGGSGSWGQPVHTFAVSASEPYPPHVAVGTAANEVVEGGVVALSGWDLVQWILGDESTADNTFTSAEQFRVKHYLASGGSLIVSGSEVGWDLVAQGGTEDKSFFASYLKSSYVFDGNTSMSTATGVAGTPFQGYTWTFGQVYPEDYPDDIEPTGGAVSLLTYNSQRDASTFRKAGIGYVGTFGTSASIGRLVYFAFPVESIVSSLQREVLFQKSLEFMGVTTGVAGSGTASDIPETPMLYQNYPNPFNPSTDISFAVPNEAFVHLTVYDLLGRRVEVLVDGERPAGTHTVRWDASRYPSGVYIVRLEAGATAQMKRIVLVK